jgi:hypothetical protein
MTLDSRHKKAIAKIRETLKDIPGIDYSSERIFPPSSISELLESLGGIGYNLSFKNVNAIILIEHVDSQLFDISVFIKNGTATLRLFSERAYFNHLRGQVGILVERASRY